MEPASITAPNRHYEIRFSEMIPLYFMPPNFAFIGFLGNNFFRMAMEIEGDLGASIFPFRIKFFNQFYVTFSLFFH